MINRIMTVCMLLLLGVSWVSAQEGQHWQCNIYDFKYDMTVYFSLQRDGAPVTNPTDYEVAVFAGSECRGVASWQTATATDGSTVYYGYLRARSNEAEAEKLTVKAWQKSTGTEIPISQMLTFASDSRVGLPSSPYILLLTSSSGLLPGDANGDGTVNVTDVVVTVDYILGKNPSPFYFDAANVVAGDGEVNVTDVVAIVDIILGRSSN